MIRQSLRPQYEAAVNARHFATAALIADACDDYETADYWKRQSDESQTYVESCNLHSAARAGWLTLLIAIITALIGAIAISAAIFLAALGWVVPSLVMGGGAIALIVVTAVLIVE